MKNLVMLFFFFSFLYSFETTTIYEVSGMMCDKNCPAKVKESLNDIKGVKSCIVDFKSKTATVVYDNTLIDSETIAETIHNKTYFKVNQYNSKSWNFFEWIFGK